ncbi:MAG: aminotransferase class IV, partial [Actinobacteria bacterium]|nr:aminotransferase class IV [Actinomycetota bacterium]
GTVNLFSLVKDIAKFIVYVSGLGVFGNPGDNVVDENSPLSGIKSLPFTENVHCLDLARSDGFDDGIRLNFKNELCESSVANLLIRIDGQWVTPDLASGCLPGITRELALEWFSIGDRAILHEELDRVEAIFLLSSLKILQPVATLKDRHLEIDMRLAEEFAQRMMENIDP